MARSRVDKINIINADYINLQIKKFLKKKKNFFRINLHKSEKEKIQFMLMFYKKGFFYPPHYSNNVTESFAPIKGRFKVIFFNNSGNIKKKILLSANKNISYKINSRIFHMIVPITKIALAIEAIDGPYKKNSVKIPIWYLKNKKRFINMHKNESF